MWTGSRAVQVLTESELKKYLVVFLGCDSNKCKISTVL